MHCMELSLRSIVSIYRKLSADLEQTALNFQHDANEEKVKCVSNQIDSAWDGEFVFFDETQNYTINAKGS